MEITNLGTRLESSLTEFSGYKLCRVSNKVAKFSSPRGVHVRLKCGCKKTTQVRVLQCDECVFAHTRTPSAATPTPMYNTA